MTTAAPSQILRCAEEIMQLQLELDTKLREGFVSLSSTRAIAGRSFNFSSLTWPTKNEAIKKVTDESAGFQVEETATKTEEEEKQQKQELQIWCGMSGAREAQMAKIEFNYALELALRIANKKRELINKK